jgi:multiple sugar transport system permease protein
MAEISLTRGNSSPPKKRIRWLTVKENLTGYLFVLPAFIIIGMFGIFPIGYGLYMSTYNWRLTKGGFIFLDNYKKAIGDWGGALTFVAGIAILVLAFWVWNNAFKANNNRQLIVGFIAAMCLMAAGLTLSMGWGKMMATGDKDFLTSLVVTLFYAIGSVPIQLFIALVLAYLLFQKIKGKDVFRMIYFLPYITPVVSTAVVFRIIFNPRETSLANMVLGWLGVSPLKWLFEPTPVINMLFGTNLEGLLAGPSLALVTIIIFGVWTFIGYNTVIFLAGLGAISKEIYEAAEIDGANAVGLFRHITFPLLSPVTFYLSLVSFIGTFKAFNHIYVMRVPSAQNTIITTSIEIFDRFYKANQYGYATSQAIILFLIILGLTYAQNRVFGKKVFYG